MPKGKGYSYMGSKTGSGNPPGKYSPGYTKHMDNGSESHFVTNKSYRGGMHVGINESAKVVGNQPKQTSSKELSMHKGSIAGYGGTK